MAILGASVINGKLEADELQVVANSGALAVNIKGNTKIDGDLEVNGDVTYIGEKDLRVQDKTIEVGYLETGSITSASLDGAGIYAGNIGAAEAFPLIKYNHNTEHIEFGKPIAAVISGSVNHAEAAAKVDHKLTIKGDGIATAVEFDGAEAKEVTINLEAYEKVADFNTYTASQATINANLLASASAAESASKAYTDAEIADLDATVANAAADAGNIDTTQIKVEVTEADGKITKVDVNAPAFQTATQAAADLQTAKDYADAAVLVEKNRALAAEATNSNAIATEASRSKAAEATLSGSIATEVSRSKAAEAQVLADAKAYTETVSGSVKEYADGVAATAKTEAVATASAYTDAQIDAEEAARDTAIAAAIAALDVDDTAEEGKYVTAVKEVDGKIEVTRATITIPDVPEYTMVKQAEAETGMAATYYLTKDDVQVGAKINIPKDQFLKSAKLYKTKAEAEAAGITVPTGTEFPAIYFVFETPAGDTPMWVTVKDLVDVYTAGNGIVITNNEIAVKVKADDYIKVDATNGLYTDGIDAAISGAVAAEATIARAAEQTNSASIAAVDAAYKAADTTLSGSIATEIVRAKAAEEANATAIQTETSAARAAEGALDTRLTAAEGEIDALQVDAHTHDNKDLLDTYTQTEANLADAVAKKHEHDNKTVLDGITATKISGWDATKTYVDASASNWDATAKWVADNKTAVSGTIATVGDNKAHWNTAYSASVDHEARIKVLETASAEYDGRLDDLEATASALPTTYMKVDGTNSNITKDLTFAEGAGIIRYANDEFEFVFAE